MRVKDLQIDSLTRLSWHCVLRHWTRLSQREKRWRIGRRGRKELMSQTVVAERGRYWGVGQTLQRKWSHRSTSLRVHHKQIRGTTESCEVICLRKEHL